MSQSLQTSLCRRWNSGPSPSTLVHFCHTSLGPQRCNTKWKCWMGEHKVAEKQRWLGAVFSSMTAGFGCTLGPGGSKRNISPIHWEFSPHAEWRMIAVHSCWQWWLTDKGVICFVPETAALTQFLTIVGEDELCSRARIAGKSVLAYFIRCKNCAALIYMVEMSNN